eukprot:GHVS01029046.1.p1 GENE.GHVS01029046.1~~GHVS01029046.1.p1  ORF type:complete len:451 (-),score=30.45 GHVS01029046.1:480-1832(-)
MARLSNELGRIDGMVLFVFVLASVPLLSWAFNRFDSVIKICVERKLQYKETDNDDRIDLSEMSCHFTYEQGKTILKVTDIHGMEMDSKVIPCDLRKHHFEAEIVPYMLDALDVATDTIRSRYVKLRDICAFFNISTTKDDVLEFLKRFMRFSKTQAMCDMTGITDVTDDTHDVVLTGTLEETADDTAPPSMKVDLHLGQATGSFTITMDTTTTYTGLTIQAVMDGIQKRMAETNKWHLAVANEFSKVGAVQIRATIPLALYEISEDLTLELSPKSHDAFYYFEHGSFIPSIRFTFHTSSMKVIRDTVQQWKMSSSQNVGEYATHIKNEQERIAEECRLQWATYIQSFQHMCGEMANSPDGVGQMSRAFMDIRPVLKQMREDQKHEITINVVLGKINRAVVVIADEPGPSCKHDGTVKVLLRVNFQEIVNDVKQHAETSTLFYISTTTPAV